MLARAPDSIHWGTLPDKIGRAMTKVCIRNASRMHAPSDEHGSVWPALHAQRNDWRARKSVHTCFCARTIQHN